MNDVGDLCASKEILSALQTDIISSVDFERVMKVAKTGPSPSIGAKSTGYAINQAFDPIFDGRYDHKYEQRSRSGRHVLADTVAVPIQIFHPVFAQFIHDEGNEAKIVPNDVLLLTVEYFRKSSAIYESETARCAALRPLLSQLFGAQLLPLDHGGNKPDGQAQCFADFFRKMVTLILAEFKNEIGTGGSCSSAQVNLNYLKILARDDDVSGMCLCSSYFAKAWCRWETFVVRHVALLSC